MYDPMTQKPCPLHLTRMIVNQEKDLENYNAAQVIEDIKKLKMEKEEHLLQQMEEVKSLVDEKLERSIVLACEKGAGTWLTALPLQSMGYTLNKQEFRDAVCLRYGWAIPNTPFHCGCGQKNSVDHTLNCKLGGYVMMRHNNTSGILKQVYSVMSVKTSKLSQNFSPLETTPQTAQTHQRRPD